MPTDAPIGAQQKGPPEIQLDELIYDENRDFLGEGTFGKVYKYVVFTQSKNMGVFRSWIGRKRWLDCVVLTSVDGVHV